MGSAFAVRMRFRPRGARGLEQARSEAGSPGKQVLAPEETQKGPEPGRGLGGRKCGERGKAGHLPATQGAGTGPPESLSGPGRRVLPLLAALGVGEHHGV